MLSNCFDRLDASSAPTAAVSCPVVIWVRFLGLGLVGYTIGDEPSSSTGTAFFLLDPPDLPALPEALDVLRFRCVFHGSSWIKIGSGCNDLWRSW